MCLQSWLGVSTVQHGCPIAVNLHTRFVAIAHMAVNIRDLHSEQYTAVEIIESWMGVRQS